MQRKAAAPLARTRTQRHPHPQVVTQTARNHVMIQPLRYMQGTSTALSGNRKMVHVPFKQRPAAQQVDDARAHMRPCPAEPLHRRMPGERCHPCRSQSTCTHGPARHRSSPVLAARHAALTLARCPAHACALFTLACSPRCGGPCEPKPASAGAALRLNTTMHTEGSVWNARRMHVSWHCGLDEPRYDECLHPAPFWSTQLKYCWTGATMKPRHAK